MVLVNPGDLAAQALGQMRLAVPAIGLAPTPPHPTYVGLETWLWMDPVSFNVLTKSVSAGATTVTVRAQPMRASWDLTDGTTTCAGAGRAWVVGMTDADETDCSYVFRHVSSREPGSTFRVTSTLTYEVDWTCSGACLQAAGSLGAVDGLPGASAISVTERQSVVVG